MRFSSFLTSNIPASQMPLERLQGGNIARFSLFLGIREISFDKGASLGHKGLSGGLLRNILDIVDKVKKRGR